MGRMHYRCWRAVAGAQVVAVCDADRQALGDEARHRGNIAGAEGEVDLDGVTVYHDYSEMLRCAALDAVSLTLPTYLHADSAIAALESGRHVLCEKPMALHLDDATRMIAAARASGKILQIGHCIRFWPEYARAKAIVDSGIYGPVIAATFQRLAATAARRTQTWFTDESRSGGMTLDLHIHDTDFIHHLFGPPRAVFSSGATKSDGSLSHIITRYEYDNKLVVAEGGWAMMPAFGFEMRFHLVLERATLSFDSRRKPALQVCPAEGDAVWPDCGTDDGYTRQIAHFARRIAGAAVPPVVTLDQAWNTLRIALAERESARRGHWIAIDGLRAGRGDDEL